ncbi:MAG: sulfite exporter TauE/SafE family protein, partial [Magnetococcales bacterium]|nr:sulfite exporter TauE/SafE family protein [Magnetococcales bacterium]
ALFSAILSVTTTMGGPPIALAVQSLPGLRFRHTLAFFFTLAGLLTLSSLTTIQRVGSTEIHQGVWLMPPVLLGIGISGFVGRWLDKGKTRRAILTVAALSGITVILRAWLTPP